MSLSEQNLDLLERVLVTGATGLVGNNVVRLLVERGAGVRVLKRPQSDPRPLEGLDVEIVDGDILDETGLARAAEGTTAVIHAAGCVLLGWRNAELHDSVNHIGARNVARAARAAGVRLLHVSTVNALGVGSWERPGDEQWVAGENLPCPYVLSKQAGGRAVRAEFERGLDAVIVYPGYMLGPWDWKPSSGQMLLQVVRRFTPMAPVGGFSVGDVRDAAEGMIAALTRGPAGRDYVLAGHNMTYFETWKRFTKVAGGRAPLCRSGPLMRMAAGRLGDLWGRFTSHEPDVNSAAVKLSDRCHYFSSLRAERELGYHVRPVEQSIADAWQWLKEFGYVH